MRPDLVLDDEDKKRRFRKMSWPTLTLDQQHQQQQGAGAWSSRESAETDQDVDDEETGNDCEEMPQIDVENLLTELAEDESFLDPETGEIYQPEPGNYFFFSPQRKTTCSQKHTGEERRRGDFINEK